MDYSAFTCNMFLIVKKKYPNISILKKNHSYYLQLENRTIDLIGSYHDYQNGKKLKEIADEVTSTINQSI